MILRPIDSVVYFPEEPLRFKEGFGMVRRVNLAPAERYGDFKFVFDWSEIKDAGDDFSSLVWKAQQRMTYRDHDYICCVGSMPATALLCMIAAEQNDGIVRLLEWSNAEGEYVVKVVNLNAQPA